MHDLFNLENPFMSTVWKIMNMILTNFLWVIFSIPIFTIGASTTAFYYTIQKVIKNERGYVASNFWHSFKQNFRQATCIWLLIGGLMFLFTWDISIMNDFADDGYVIGNIAPLFYVFIALELIYCMYLFPYVARFHARIRDIYKNSLLLILRHPLRALGIVGFLAFGLFVMWLLPILVLLMPSVTMWQISILQERTFRLYMSDEDKELEDKLNLVGQKRG